MNKLFPIASGILFTIVFSWVGIAYSGYLQLGGLERHVDEVDDRYPPPVPGIAQRGSDVYVDLGCMYCHTQQVRRPEYGSDREREWGERQSVARDYIGRRTVVPGVRRIGPDLMTIGEREDSRAWHHRHLYDPRIESKGSTMPPYAFLYETRRVVGEPSPHALELPEEHRPAEGYEIVPTPRAEALVEYLLSLKLDYDLPEAAREEPENNDE